jgi:hypothetical protein
MSGLKFDDAVPGVINARTHGIIDYIHAGTNLLFGALFLRSNKRAAFAAFALGGNVLFNALMTDYPLGVFRVWSFKTHGILDYGVAATSAMFPTLLGFTDSGEALYFHIQGGGEAGIAALTDYQDQRGASKIRHSSQRKVRRIA